MQAWWMKSEKKKRVRYQHSTPKKQAEKNRTDSSTLTLGGRQTPYGLPVWRHLTWECIWEKEKAVISLE